MLSGFYKHVSLVLLVFLSAAPLFAQSVRVEYTQRKKEALSPEQKKPVQTKNAILIAETNTALYEELAQPSASSTSEPSKQNFGQVAPSDLESLQKNIAALAANYQTAAPLQKVYKSVGDNLVVSILKSEDYWLRMEDTLRLYNWIIFNEVAMIAGMACRKASYTNDKGMPTEAWFTDEIPIMHGPNNYHGLPGLILKIETENTIIEANKISFVTSQLIEKPTEGELIQRDDLKKRIIDAAIKGMERKVRETVNEFNQNIKN